MSNLTFVAPVDNYTSAETFARGRARRLAYATRVVPSSDHGQTPGRPATYSVEHHGTTIATYRRVADVLDAPAQLGTFLAMTTLDTGGYDPATTARRLHMLIPREHRGRWLSIGRSGGRTVVRDAYGYETPMRRLHLTLSGGAVVETPGGRFIRVTDDRY